MSHKYFFVRYSVVQCSYKCLINEAMLTEIDILVLCRGPFCIHLTNKNIIARTSKLIFYLFNAHNYTCLMYHEK